MIDAAQDMMAAWDKVRFELRKRWELVDQAAPVETPTPIVEVEAAPVEIEVVTGIEPEPVEVELNRSAPWTVSAP